MCEIAVRGRCTAIDIIPAMEENQYQHHSNNIVDVSGRNTVIGGGYGSSDQYHHRRAVTMMDASTSTSRRNHVNYNNNNSYSYGRSGSGGIGAMASGGGGGGSGSGNVNSSNSSSNRGRFNIEVDEVHSIRNSQALSSWKEMCFTTSSTYQQQQQQHRMQQQQQQQQSQSPRAVHVPLRLDIYYEYDSYSCNYDNYGTNNNNNITTAEQPPPPPPQRELLERWCIDYYILPSSSTSSSSSTTTSSSQLHHHHHNRSSSSPYASPSSSPYSSIVMTGVRPDKSTFTATSTNTAATSTTSQLRRVCRRIVVLLRSLHCMTRMLPAYRLRCLLLSNIARRDYNGASFDGFGTGGSSAAGGGWGTIGSTLYIAAAADDDDGPEPLPSPSFAVRSFPMVPTPYGHLSLSVMYDATLDPQRMIADVAERRGGWMLLMRQQRMIWEQQKQQHHPNQPQQIQQLERPVYQEHNQYGPSPPPPPEMLPTYSAMETTPHIPIPSHMVCQQQRQHDGMSSGGGQQNHMSCPPTTAWMMPMMDGGVSQNITPSSLGGGARSRAVSDFIIQDYHGTSTPPQHHYPARPPSVSSSLKVHSTVNSTGDNYVGERMSSGHVVGSDVRSLENKRVMSGLSLAMMNENDAINTVVQKAPEHRRANSANEYGRRCLGDNEKVENENDGLFVLPFGSLASRRAAFHTPPPPLLSENPSGGSSGTHFFHHHGGYGYGYNNGSHLQFGNEQQHWDERVLLTSPSLQSQPECTGVARSDEPRNYLSHDAGRLVGTTPLTNRTRSGSGTPPTAAHWSRSPLVASSPMYYQQQPQSLSPSGAQVQSKHNRPAPSISLSMSVQQSMLPPITSLDMLQKSPFNIAPRKMHSSSTSGKESKYRESDEGGGPRQDDEMLMFLSSIPRMVPSATIGDKSDCIVAVSALGDDPSSIPNLPTSIDSVVAVDADGGHNSSNEPLTSGGCSHIGNSNGNSACRKSFLPQAELHHLPFAADDDDAMLAVAPTSSSSPTKSLVGATTSRSLWGSTKADVMDGTMGGGMAEIATSLAVSSLHHRCATDGKIRLKMFEGAKSTIVEAVPNTNNVDSIRDPSLDFASIQDKLSDFRSFGASLMISSTHHEESK